MNHNAEHSPLETGQTNKISRRGFLKTGITMAALGLVGVGASTGKAANAAAATSIDYDYLPPKGKWSVLRPNPDYGGASVKFIGQSDQNLGTSKIVGEVKRLNEKDFGFPQAALGNLGPKAKAGIYTLGPRYPLGFAVSDAIGPISAPENVDGTPNPNKLPIPDPEQMSMNIKDTAYYLRADEVGIGIMPEYAYYASQMAPPLGAIVNGHVPDGTPIENVPVEEKLPYVICVAVEQHLETYMASTGYDGIANTQSMRSYHASANIAIIMASYIRQLGYHARAHHFGNYGAVMGPCLISAGMGEHTRSSDCVAHPRMGFRNKVAAITTDLPLVPDKPIDFGMQDFCRVCMKCANECPAQAISFDRDPTEYNGYLRWNGDPKKCTEFRAANDEGNCCGRCLKVCPWNSKEDSWFHEAGIWIGSKGEASASFLKSIDDMFGYGTEVVDRWKWWIEWPELYKFTY